MMRTGTYRGWKVYRFDFSRRWVARKGVYVTAAHPTYAALCAAIDRGEFAPCAS